MTQFLLFNQLSLQDATVLLQVNSVKLLNCKKRKGLPLCKSVSTTAHNTTIMFWTVLKKMLRKSYLK